MRRKSISKQKDKPSAMPTRRSSLNKQKPKISFSPTSSPRKICFFSRGGQSSKAKALLEAAQAEQIQEIQIQHKNDQSQDEAGCTAATGCERSRTRGADEVSVTATSVTMARSSDNCIDIQRASKYTEMSHEEMRSALWGKQ